MSRRRTKKRGNKNAILIIACLLLLGLLYKSMGNSMFFVVPAIILLVIFLPKFIPILIHTWGYSKSEYYRITHRPWFKLVTDKGAYGEYLIYRHLDKKIEGEHYWLFNTYLPRSQTRTTEIDVVLFCSSGIYVFESKNYKGWIFGTENHRVWTQCIKPSQDSRAIKYRFLNPIMQNKLHVTCLKKLLTEEQTAIPVHSIVLFGNRCKLKNIRLTSGKHQVITLDQLFNTYLDIASYTPYYSSSALRPVYNLLYPMTQVSEEIKQKHIADIEAEIRAGQNQIVDNIDEYTLEEITIADEQGCPVTTDSADVDLQPLPADETPTEDSSTDNGIHCDDSVAVSHVAQIDKNEVCPRCGAALILRTAKKGDRQGTSFVGCSRFPKCRYTK